MSLMMTKEQALHITADSQSRTKIRASAIQLASIGLEGHGTYISVLHTWLWVKRRHIQSLLCGISNLSLTIGNTLKYLFSLNLLTLPFCFSCIQVSLVSELLNMQKALWPKLPVLSLNYHSRSHGRTNTFVLYQIDARHLQEELSQKLLEQGRLLPLSSFSFFP
jgi:hypothetical protein